MVLVTVDNPFPKCTTFTPGEENPDAMQYNLYPSENTIGDLKDAMTADCEGGGRGYITISKGVRDNGRPNILANSEEVVQGQHYQSSYSGRKSGGKKRRKTRKKTRRKMRRKSSGGKKRRKKSKTRKRKSRKQKRKKRPRRKSQNSLSLHY